MTANPDTPRSRRDRPAKPPLTREGIVTAAVRVMKDEGLGKVTMRRLAQELDTGAASLYVYFGNADALHAAILDRLLGTVEQPPARGPWRARLEAVLASCTGVLFTHPSLARAALSARPSGENYLTLIETLLALLAEGGVPPRQAAWGVDVLLQYATSTAAEHATQQASDSAGNDWDALTQALHAADPDDRPHIAAHAGALLSGTPEERFGWGVAVLLTGILHTPAPGGTQEGAETP
ncbi:TetR/AcrR family transcriptional regulator [Streptomyces sp. NPDC002574]|uniref:TetR/AcrR family transcriptional regulator n=1 Tax=Streptomyces sp. NPDC002574 TaxID=3364652 RepID=UPI0036B03E96